MLPTITFHQKIFVFVIVVAIAIVIATTLSNSTVAPPALTQEMTACSENSDCVMVAAGNECCPCGNIISINKNFFEEYTSKRSQYCSYLYSGSGVICPMIVCNTKDRPKATPRCSNQVCGKYN